MFKKIIAGFTLAATIIGSAGVANAAEPETVKLWGASSTVNAYHGFLFMGNPLGFYEDEGVNVEFGTAAGSAATLQLLATNKVQLGYMGMDVLILAKAKNPTLPVKAVYLQDRGNIYEIVVPNDSDIKTVADLKDKNIGVANLASGAIPKLKAMLSDAGLHPEKSVGLIPVGNGAQAAAALRSGRVQALALFRAQHALIESLGWEFRYFTKDAPSAVIAANTDFLEKHPEVAAKVLRGVAQSSAFAQANPEATVREFWNLFGRTQGVSEEDAMASAKHILSSTSKLWKDHTDDTVKWGDMTADHWNQMQDALVAAKLMKEPIDPNTLFTTDLIEEINKADIAKALKVAKSAM
jgi:NitT/TauT family transport system substrate-binding protein